MQISRILVAQGCVAVICWSLPAMYQRPTVWNLYTITAVIVTPIAWVVLGAMCMKKPSES